MFKTIDHFKEATKAAYDALRSNPSMKLSVFRNIFIDQSDYASFQAYADSFKIQNDVLSQLEKEASPLITLMNSFAQGVIMRHVDLDINIDIILPSNEFVVFKSTEDNFFEVTLDTEGLFILASEDDDSIFEVGGSITEPMQVRLFNPVRKYLPKPAIGISGSLTHSVRDSQNLNIVYKATPPKGRVSVMIVTNGEIEVFASYPDDHQGNLQANNAFVDAMSQKLSNFVDYSKDDIDACLEAERENFGAGFIQIVRSHD